ncbi:MAG TPA: winged helix DNA-binding domain-containing protein [Gemmatimonadales bacterium]|jgi:hypothetical protein|nr:winged helix DNA-binding domain-containing protein [Gemmatimonadales bacterium]
MALSPARRLLLERFRVQRLHGTPFPTTAAAVGALCCVQSQDPLGAKWSLGMRVKGATDASIDRDYDAGKFLRTHILRPTWHYVLPEDIRWILALTSPHVLRANRTQEQRLGLTGKVLARCEQVIGKALEGGKHTTREGLGAALARAGIKAEGQKLAYVMMALELNALICSGAMQGKQHTYALLEERAGGRRTGERIVREEAVAELLRRFVAGHAPATLKQFCWWSGLKLTEARKAREALKDSLAIESIDGTEWVSSPSRTTKSQQPAAHLIPEYDEVLVGTADIGIPRLMADRRIPGRTTNTFDRPLLIGGEWVGTWRRTVGPKRVVLEVERFGRFTREQAGAVEQAVAKYEAFVGLEVEHRSARCRTTAAIPPSSCGSRR